MTRCFHTHAQTLAANRILSAPVVATSETTGTGTPRISVTSEDITDVLGFVDLRDVLASFLRGVRVDVLHAFTLEQQQQHLELDGSSIKNMKMLQRLRVLESKGQEFASKSLRELKGSGAC